MNKLQNIIEELNRRVISNDATCPVCRRSFTDETEIEILKQEGECASCSHIRGELLEDQSS